MEEEIDSEGYFLHLEDPEVSNVRKVEVRYLKGLIYSLFNIIWTKEEEFSFSIVLSDYKGYSAAIFEKKYKDLAWIGDRLLYDYAKLWFNEYKEIYLQDPLNNYANLWSNKNMHFIIKSFDLYPFFSTVENVHRSGTLFEILFAYFYQEYQMDGYFMKRYVSELTLEKTKLKLK
jgi:hypothetical protein